jgi:hypothetical protein
MFDMNEMRPIRFEVDENVKKLKAPKSGRKLSEILRAVADDETRERVSIADLFEAMGDRAFGALMLVFAFPNVIPTPPGTSAILGAPLIFLTAQMMLGMKPWLPKLIANRSMLRQDFATIVNKANPWLAWAEKALRARLTTLSYPPFEYVIGFICLVLAVVLTLPIPLGNMLPALAICIFSFGILERDGLWIIGGMVMSLVSLVVAGGVIWGFVQAALFFLSRILH